MIGLALGPHHIAAAYRTVLWHDELSRAPRMLAIVNDARDLRDHVSAALDFDPVAYLHTQALDLVHVVQRGAAHGRASDGHRLQLRNWRELSGTPYLHVDVLNLRSSGTRSIFVRNRPARG